MRELIRCPVCQTHFRRKDIVVLDIINTITHSRCVGNSSHGFPVKDSGMYTNILARYPFFMESYDESEVD